MIQRLLLKFTVFLGAHAVCNVEYYATLLLMLWTRVNWLPHYYKIFLFPHTRSHMTHGETCMLNSLRCFHLAEWTISFNKYFKKQPFPYRYKHDAGWLAAFYIQHKFNMSSFIFAFAVLLFSPSPANTSLLFKQPGGRCTIHAEIAIYHSCPYYGLLHATIPLEVNNAMTISYRTLHPTSFEC